MNIGRGKQGIYNLIFALGLIGGIVLLKASPKALTVSSPNVSGVRIVLDAGHGGPDGGAIGCSGVLEKDINLSVAKKLGSLLQQSGAEVVYTRESDDCISPDKSLSIAKLKLADMKKRAEIRDGSGADLFISIHMNKFSDSAQSGSQVFYSSNSAESKNLAENIQKYLKKFVNPKNKRLAKESGRSIYILNNANIPCVVVACGFLSNPQEEGVLCKDDYQQKIAFSIYSGIIEYINTDNYKEMHTDVKR